MSIACLPYSEIDLEKWDRCIRNSYNGLIYSTSAYLNAMAGSWDGLVLNDYEAVMPLPWRKKWGLHYVYPPAFTQQLGITALQKETSDTVDQFINSIPKKFRYFEMNFNTTNVVAHLDTVARKNYMLPLNSEYEKMAGNYSRSAKRNILKAKSSNSNVVENISPEKIIALHRVRFKDNVGSNNSDYQNLTQLIKLLAEKNETYCIGATDSNGTLIAGSIYTVFKSRLTFIINGNTNESLQNGATHLLMDFTIQKFSNSGFILDFEGSDHPAFARFYEQYGATPETYYFLRQNNLPFPVNLLKPGRAKKFF